MRKVGSAVAALVLGGIALFTFRPAAAASATVDITDTGLSPAEVTIHGGESVTWVNKTQHDVSITSDDGRFNGQTFSGEFTNRFDRRGDYGYTSSQGPNSHGVVHVVDDAPTAPPPPSTTSTEVASTLGPKSATTRTTAGVLARSATSTTGTQPITVTTIRPTTTTTTTTTVAGPPTTGGEFAIGGARSSHRGALVGVIAAGVVVLGFGGYLAYRRRLRSPY